MSLVLMLLACSAPEATWGRLVLEDANVLPISGGLVEAPVAVADGADLCFDVTVLGSEVAAVEVWKTDLSEAALRCAIGLDTLSQADVVGGFVLGASTECLSGGTTVPEGMAFRCEPGATWLTLVRDGVGRTLDHSVLDPCVGSTNQMVRFDGVEPAVEPVEIGEAVDLSATPGVDYTVDWSALTRDGFGDPVDPAELLRLRSRVRGDEETLTDAVLDVAEGAVETWVDAPGDAQVELAAADLSGLEVGHDFVFGVDPGAPRCVDAPVAVRVVSGP